MLEKVDAYNAKNKSERGSVTLVESVVIMTLVGVIFYLAYKQFTSSVKSSVSKDKCIVASEDFAASNFVCGP